MDQFSRLELLIGEERKVKLATKSVITFGIGGVGSYAAEALARSGIGKIGIVDDDLVCITNINRQLIANLNTVGQSKIKVMEQQILNINPQCVVDTYSIFYDGGSASHICLKNYDYVLDAIDTISSKLLLIEESKKQNVPIISSMGMGNRFDPTKIEILDVFKTKNDPLSKVMRKELRQRGIDKLTVAFSSELPTKPNMTNSLDCNQNCICPKGSSKICIKKREIPGSTAFVPPVAGLAMASYVVRELANI
jgi:tRNA A37 threonylcarbamoyladenosine dehydratase